MRSKSTRPKPPPGLSKEAKTEFKRLCDELESVDRLHTADRAIIALYLQLWDVYRNAANEVSITGAVITGNNNIRGMTPDFKTMDRLARQLRGLLRDLGLTPSARDRGAVKQQTTDDEPLDID